MRFLNLDIQGLEQDNGRVSAEGSMIIVSQVTFCK